MILIELSEKVFFFDIISVLFWKKSKSISKIRLQNKIKEIKIKIFLPLSFLVFAREKFFVAAAVISKMFLDFPAPVS